MKDIICKTCRNEVETDTLFSKTDSNIHHAGCEECGWYESHRSRLTLGYLIFKHCDIEEYCDDCGYTERDKLIHGDHHLCSSEKQVQDTLKLS